MNDYGLGLMRIRNNIRTQQQILRQIKRYEMYNKRRPNILTEGKNWKGINNIDLINLTELIKNSEVDADVLRIIKRTLAKGEKYIQIFMNLEGFLHKLVRFITGSDVEKMLEAIGCCTNICFSSHDTVFEIIKMAGPYLITYLHGNSPVLQEYCCRCLGNMAADCIVCCKLLRRQGLVHAMISLLQSQHLQVVQSCLFVLQNFSRHYHQEEIETLLKEDVLSVLSNLLSSKLSDVYIIADIYYILFNLTTQIENWKEYFYKESIHQNALNHLNYFTSIQPINIDVITAIIRCLGNLSSGNNAFSFDIICHPFFEPNLIKLLNSSHLHIRRETLWFFNNIIISCDDQLLWKNINLVSIIDIILLLISDKNTQSEAMNTLYALANKQPMCSTIVQNELATKLQNRHLYITDIDKFLTLIKN